MAKKFFLFFKNTFANVFHFLSNSKSATELSNARKRNDLGLMNLDIDVDLSHLFNWNCKQLFLYITAEYETKQNVIY